MRTYCLEALLKLPLVSDETFHVADTGKNLWEGKVTQVKAFYGTSKREQLHSTINVGTMTNSVIQSNSPGAVQNVTFIQSQQVEIRELVSGLRSALDKLGLDDEQRVDLETDVETIETQLKNPSRVPR